MSTSNESLIVQNLLNLRNELQPLSKIWKLCYPDDPEFQNDQGSKYRGVADMCEKMSDDGKLELKIEKVDGKLIHMYRLNLEMEYKLFVDSPDPMEKALSLLSWNKFHSTYGSKSPKIIVSPSDVSCWIARAAPVSTVFAATTSKAARLAPDAVVEPDLIVPPETCSLRAGAVVPMPLRLMPHLHTECLCQLQNFLYRH